MSLKKHRSRTLALFCKVVDNYGDIGICWRLARQLQVEYGVSVTLWVDDLVSFQRICPEVAVEREEQQIASVTVRHWRDQEGVFAASDVADIVIEFFACDIPPGYITAMAQRSSRAVWLNLEGLSAQEWVEGCHTLSSPHSSLPLTKYFFFPGFTSRTGGLLRESSLEQERQQFQSDQLVMARFLAQFGVSPVEMASLKVSLFCYPQAPVAGLFDVWIHNERAITCLVPQGVAFDAVESFLGGVATVGASRTRGALTVHVLPFVPQADYDKLLWACDLNFVRGEDSFVRAQWAEKPFIWHIYPQDEDLHLIKLNAFLQSYVEMTTINSVTGSLTALSLNWNGASTVTTSGVNGSTNKTPISDGPDWTVIWRQFQADMPKITIMSIDWQRQMVLNGDLASHLLKFVDTIA